MKISDFQVLKMIGAGGFGRVYLAVNKKATDVLPDRQMVAIKVISKEYANSITKEKDALTLLSNQKFVSHMFGAFQDLTRTFIVLRFEQNGSLRQLLNRMPTLPLGNARNLVTHIALGLHCLHSNNLMHADLKMDNVLVDENMRAHIGDFGLVLPFDNGALYYGKHGSPHYQSPEQLLGTVAWDQRNDFFALGIIFLRAITGRHPFGSSDSEINDNTLNLQYNMPPMTDDGCNFVKSTLCFQNIRLTSDTILKHPFIPPNVEKAIETYKPSATMFRGVLLDEPFVDKKNFFEPIPGIDFESNVSVQDLPTNDVFAKLTRQLDKSLNTRGAEIRKVAPTNWRIRCKHCTESIKAATYLRRTLGRKRAYNIQPFVRHLKTHERKNAAKKARKN